VRAAIPLELL
jgi:hypothetical protein